MRDEIAAAVDFISRLLKRNKNVTSEQLEKFSDQLSSILLERFTNHWHTNEPLKGQGYRCIRVNECKPVDPVLLKAAQGSGINFHELELPSELTLWVDPSEVCCRFGEIKSSYYTVASVKDGKLDNRARALDLEDLISEHNRKREEDLNKLKEFTERRSPNFCDSSDMILHYQPSGEVHMPMMNGMQMVGVPYGGSRWGAPPKSYHSGTNGHYRRSPPAGTITSSPSSSRNRSSLTLGSRSNGSHTESLIPGLTSNGHPVNGSMKTGHRQHHPHNKQWVNKVSSATQAAKA